MIPIISLMPEEEKEEIKPPTNDLEVGNSSDPILVTNLMGRPTLWPNGRVQRGEITNRKQPTISFHPMSRPSNSRVTLGEETETANDVSFTVCRERRQGVLLEHLANVLQLPLGLGIRLGIDPFLTGLPGEVRLGY
jgi:hypothetical protein